MGYIFIEIPKFNKAGAELANNVDKWLYLLKNLNKLEKTPLFLNRRIFNKLFKIAEVGSLNEEDMNAYQESLKIKRDNLNAMRTVREEGLEKGKRQKAIEIAVNLKKQKIATDTIAAATGISRKEIEEI